MSDLSNWYEKLPKDLKQQQKNDKNFKKHFIKPRAMITCIGGTGSGKTNALIDFLSRKDESFYKIILFNPVSTDEPLFNLMKKMLPEMEVYTDVNQLPELASYPDEENDEEKLIIFDDFINLKPKEMKKILPYFTGGRKKGFTCFAMCQNYTSVPKVITRNTHYFIIFKLNDTHTVRSVLKNHNIENVPDEDFKRMYLDSTKEPLNFFMVDLKGGAMTHLRHNFTGFYKLK